MVRGFQTFLGKTRIGTEEFALYTVEKSLSGYSCTSIVGQRALEVIDCEALAVRSAREASA